MESAVEGTVEPAVEWPVFESALIGRELVAERTMSFRFEKPSGWDYVAGQFIDITLHEPPETDAEGNTRGFSISSAPSEGVIQVTTRLRDTAFKRVLQYIPLGTLMKLEGPFGEFALDDSDRPAVVLTGGIGITPFRSILVEAKSHGGLTVPVTVVHANRLPADAAFMDELRGLAEQDANLTFVPTMTGDVSSSWAGERGRIDVPMIRRHADTPNPIYYITGPEKMVAGLHHMLRDAGVTDEAIRTEEFTGY